MATVRNKKGRFSKSGVVLRAEKVGELKASVVKDKPLINTVEENKDEPRYHNVSCEKLFEGIRRIDLLFGQLLKDVVQYVGNCRILRTYKDILC